MKAKSQAVKTIGGACAMVVLILDAETALRGSLEGIELCIRSVIPALFPFLICSIYLTGNLGNMQIPLLRPMGRLCRIPPGSEGILLTGLLGGYPVGAQSVTQAFEAGCIRREDALRMLGFCSNAGPAFLFGMLSPCFSGSHTPWILWGIQLLSAIAGGVMLPGGSNREAACIHKSGITVPQAMNRALGTMASICGWVIGFRTIILFVDRWFLWMMPEQAGLFLTGLLELTNGCVNLSSVEDESLRFLMAVLFLSAGGLCVGMQTVSVTGGLGTGWYFPGKLLQTGIALLLCGLIMPMIYPGSAVPWLVPGSFAMTIFLIYSFRIRKNNSSNFGLLGV